MKPSILLSALALSVSVAAAPLAAEEAKPTASTQAAPLVLGGLGAAGTAALVVAAIVVVGAIADGGDSSSSTPVTE